MFLFHHFRFIFQILTTFTIQTYLQILYFHCANSHFHYLQAEAPKTYEVEGTIIKKSGIGGGGHRRNFYLVLGPKDGSEPVIIMIYNASLDSTFVKDRTVRLTGLVKRDQTLLYVSSSRSSFKSPYAPSKEQLEAASSMMFPADGPSTKTSVKRSISQALADETTRSTVVGKVVKVS